jgi:hypothetical protein
MLSPSRLRGYIQARSVWKAVNYPIYIPEQDRDIAALLVKCDAAELAEVLERRASLGSGRAAAILGYLELMGAFSGQSNPKATIACCTAPAKAGDSYAQYVLSWAYWETGNWADALHWMKRSASDPRFLPARVDLGRMLARMAASAGNAGHSRTAVKTLWDAHKRGHVGALAQICRIALGGHLGPLSRMLGIVLFPYAATRLLLGLQCDPFGIRTFAFVRDPDKPFFNPLKSKRDTDPCLVFDRKALVTAYVVFALCAALAFISHIDLSWTAYAGYTSGIGALFIAAPALIPYLLSGLAAWNLLSKSSQLMMSYRRVRLYLMILVMAILTVVSAMLMVGAFDFPLTPMMVVGLLIAETVVFLAAPGVFLSDEWRST